MGTVKLEHQTIIATLVDPNLALSKIGLIRKQYVCIKKPVDDYCHSMQALENP